MGGAGGTFHPYVRAKPVLDAAGLQEAPVKPRAAGFTARDSLRTHFSLLLALIPVPY